MRKLAHWLEELSEGESLDFYRELALSHARESGADGEVIARYIQKCDFRRLCEFEVDYESGVSAHQVSNLRQALAFFQKLEFLDIGIDKEEAALRKFFEAEKLCRETNALMVKYRSGDLMVHPRVGAVIHRARLKCAAVLGAVPSIGDLSLHFGPGATRATRRSESSVRRKIAERLQCSEGLELYVKYILHELPHLTEVHSQLTRVDEDGVEWDSVAVEITTAKLSFVPKTAKTYRSICTEPGLNTMCQLGIGEYMARRLAAVGVDIRDQTRNQRLAQAGSVRGDLATLDLSSASDTISREVVYELLPLEWACFLDRFRSKKVELPDGRILSQEKFSSMGNGFTFPLETLIFWSLATACCDGSERNVSVYGDDIIVPVTAYDLLSEVLHVLGFVVNQQKSYKTGPFRESCGKDYFRGTDVRPYYPKGLVSAQSLFVLHNFYVRRGDTERARMVRNRIHPSLWIFGPDGYGDGHLLGEHPKRRSKHAERSGYAGYFFDTYVTRNPRDLIPLARGEYVVPLYSVYRRGTTDFCRFSPSGGIDKFAFVTKFLRRAHGPRGYSPLPLATAKDEVKSLPLPGVSGYKKISVYTLGD